jgi:hypothetical protein
VERARAGMTGGVTLAYVVQHGEKEPLPGDPGLTGTGREQATCTGSGSATWGYAP